MNSMHKDQFDAAIVGAGIGGLIAGCYLAKAGMKVIMLELNSNPGGYCCSFTRHPYKFDVGAHYMGSLREGGQLNTIFNELDLFNRIKINRISPSDLILSTDNTCLKITSNLTETINNFQNACPNESRENFNSFFELINEPNLFKLINTARKFDKFESFAKKYFKHNRTLNFLNSFFGNCGSIDQIYTIPALILYREFILDGGYYPIGGFGKMSFTLVDYFKSLGGIIHYGEEVTRILTVNRRAVGVETKKKNTFHAKHIISNCDITHLANNLIDKDILENKTKKLILSKKVSNPAFIVYLALSDLPKRIKEIGTFGGAWWIPETKARITDRYIDLTKNSNKHTGPFFVTLPTFFDPTLAPTGHHIMRLQIIASFKGKPYWDKNKYKLSDVLIQRAEKILGPFKHNIIKRFTASPWDFYRYTLNRDGAMVGWAPIKTNFTKSIRLNIENLHQVGHWRIFPGGQGGVAMAATTGKIVAKTILS